MKSNKFLYLLAGFVCMIITTSQAQEFISQQNQPQVPFWQNVRFGGSLGLGFGNGFFNGSLAPSAIYDFNQIASAGFGISVAYASQNNFKSTSFGGSLIGILRPIRQIQLSAEFEQLNINRRYELDGGNLRDNYWVPALFLGVGYNTGPVVTGIRYNVLHDNQKSFYSNALMPFVSIYF